MTTIKLTGISNGLPSTVGDTDTSIIDGSLTVGNADSDNIVFNAEIDSDFIPDDDNSFDLGSSSKRWAQMHANHASFEDIIQVDLSIPGAPLETDTNAYRFNCPYNLEVTGLRLDLDTHGTSGNVTVTVASGATTMITLSATGTNTSATTTTVSNGTRSTGDEITLAITATPTSNTDGLRANLFFKRTL